MIGRIGLGPHGASSFLENSALFCEALRKTGEEISSCGSRLHDRLQQKDAGGPFFVHVQAATTALDKNRQLVASTAMEATPRRYDVAEL